MNEHAEIVPVDPKLTANFVFVAFLQKYAAKNATVAFRHFLQNLMDFLFHLLGSHCPKNVDG
jgi:hypothetical protein